jgi:hypothetical protein
MTMHYPDPKECSTHHHTIFLKEPYYKSLGPPTGLPNCSQTTVCKHFSSHHGC